MLIARLYFEGPSGMGFEILFRIDCLKARLSGEGFPKIGRDFIEK